MICLITIVATLALLNGQSNLVNAESTAARPPFRNYAAMTRYLVHKSNWTSLATLSIADDIKGYPVASVVSVADSEWGNKSTGGIYFYMSNLSFSWKNIQANNKITALFSEDQDLSCSSIGRDPMEPTCARAIISGKMTILNKNNTEYDVAENGFVQRHPASKKWREIHGFYFCKLAIEKITVLTAHGGARSVKVDEYYSANYDA